MNLLIIHQNFPAQYRHIALHLARDPGNTVVAIGRETAGKVAGVRRLLYRFGDLPQRSKHALVADFESRVTYGDAVRKALLEAKRRGFRPDVICAHPGWGEALFVKDVYPDVPRLDYCEFYYHGHGADVNFDPKHPSSDHDLARIRAKNAALLLSLESCDRGISPTWWQHSQFPEPLRSKIDVIHDGIDTRIVKPSPDAKLTLPNGEVVGRDDELVTYVARNLEPYRGFPNLVRAVGLILERRPNAKVVIVGGDEVSYGRRLPEGQTYRQQMLEEVPLDPNRVHFLGRIPYAEYLKVIQASTVHLYLTVPFVLSWSMLEAMAAGCIVVGSDTPPVAEVIEDGRNGLLADFFSPEAFADRVDEVLDHPNRMASIRDAARQTVLDRYDLSQCLPAHLALIESLASGSADHATVSADPTREMASIGRD
ncbi:MAG: glycosyl transferase family 1 [Rhodospirillaceae bacterium]|nr:glycosyl transferase family 1 [Rhodospirillaceae bacterium]